MNEMNEEPHQPSPQFIYQANRDKLTALRMRLLDACVQFEKLTRQTLLLSRSVTESKNGMRATYNVPDTDGQLSQFIGICRWFLGALSDAWTEHIAERRHLSRGAAVAAFEAESKIFTAQAFEHNWTWGIQQLKLRAVDPEFWEILAAETIETKTKELRSIWPEAVLQKPLPERMDDHVAREKITHDELAFRIEIGRTSYFRVKAGGGGKRARKLTEEYLAKVPI